MSRRIGEMRTRRQQDVEIIHICLRSNVITASWFLYRYKPAVYTVRELMAADVALYATKPTHIMPEDEASRMSAFLHE